MVSRGVSLNSSTVLRVPPRPPMDFADADLPPSFDWRDHLGSDWTTPVKDQQNCGDCWAFSAVGVSELS